MPCTRVITIYHECGHIVDNHNRATGCLENHGYANLDDVPAADYTFGYTCGLKNYVKSRDSVLLEAPTVPGYCDSACPSFHSREPVGKSTINKRFGLWIHITGRYFMELSVAGIQLDNVNEHIRLDEWAEEIGEEAEDRETDEAITQNEETRAKEQVSKDRADRWHSDHAAYFARDRARSMTLYFTKQVYFYDPSDPRCAEPRSFLRPVDPRKIDKDEPCPICLETLQIYQPYKLPCGHTYHLDCITPWLEIW